jgi:hypothetical protein
MYSHISGAALYQVFIIFCLLSHLVKKQICKTPNQIRGKISHIWTRLVNELYMRLKIHHSSFIDG